MACCDDATVYNFKVFGDERGKLVAMEGGGSIPFEIKRVFYIYDADPLAVRGCHANRESDFLLVCVSGECSVRLRDAHGSEVVVLDSPGKGLFIPHMLWKEMYGFSEHAVLAVFSNRHFDPDEYLEDFEEYLRLIGE